MPECMYYRIEFISDNNPVFPNLGTTNHLCTKGLFRDPNGNIIQIRNCSFMNDFTECPYFQERIIPLV